jgi:hypothetical protein
MNNLFCVHRAVSEEGELTLSIKRLRITANVTQQHTDDKGSHCGEFKKGMLWAIKFSSVVAILKYY